MDLQETFENIDIERLDNQLKIVIKVNTFSLTFSDPQDLFFKIGPSLGQATRLCRDFF